MRGFGLSGKPYGKYNYDQFATDIKTVLDKLNIKDAILGGHSMGGAISLHYVAKFNAAHVKKLVLFDAVAAKFTLSPTSLTPGLGNWLGGIEAQSSPYATEQALIALRDEDLRSDLPKIKIPTLILHATHDSIVSYALAEQMKAGIKNATLVPFEKSGHAAFIEEKDKTNAELIKFIKE
ncbi:non-heme chloroperoxidase [Chitinophaga sp. W3I9]